VVRLVLLTPGLFLGRHGEKFIVKRGGVVVEEVEASGVEEIVIGGRGIVISSDALRLAVEKGVDVIVLGPRGLPLGLLHHLRLSGLVAVRREQLRAYDDERGLVLAKGFIEGRFHGMIYVLRRLIRRVDEDLALKVVEELKQLIGELREVEAMNVEEVRDKLMSIEARGADRYWQAWRRIVEGFPGRVHRGARDPYNMALNYGYSLLYGEVLRALLRVGLDPLAGYLHSDRWGRLSLVYDLVEEFRHPIVDYVILREIIRGKWKPEISNQRLTRETRTRIIELVNSRLDQKLANRTREASTLRDTILVQAHRIAEYVTGRSRSYKPFKMRA